MNVGYSSAKPPIKYVGVDPMDQKAVDDTIGPSALAKAPRDLKMPSTVPFWSKFPYLAVRVVMHVTQKAVAVGWKT